MPSTPSGTRLSLPVPADFVLARDLCSYGYFLLEPNHWDPGTQVYTTTLDLGGAATTLRVKQAASRTGRAAVSEGRTFPAGGSLSVQADRELSADDRRAVKGAITRILRLDESAELIAKFHAADARYAPSGRGRLMRSATLFEDVLKTVTSCNVTWPGTVSMNAKLCRVLGRKSPSGMFAYPTASRLAAARPAALRARCSVGYRDARIVELSRLFSAKPRRDGSSHPEVWIQDSATPDDAFFKRLQDLPGVGPYAAANIMQLLGRYSRLPLDTESVRHGRSLLGYKGTSARIMRRLHKHYEPFGEHKFRSYWFELWDYYEAKRGRAWTWEKETTGKTFTAALLD